MTKRELKTLRYAAKIIRKNSGCEECREYLFGCSSCAMSRLAIDLESVADFLDEGVKSKKR